MEDDRQKNAVQEIDDTISIHVPRVEDDWICVITKVVRHNFNPRPPCGGRQLPIMKKLTTPAISIHVPRVEDDAVAPLAPLAVEISIHVPRVEDDTRRQLRQPAEGGFQSTSPVWRTTDCSSLDEFIAEISIHVPRVEDDGRKTMSLR